jgi:hypothetical protein
MWEKAKAAVAFINRIMEFIAPRILNAFFLRSTYRREMPLRAHGLTYRSRRPVLPVFVALALSVAEKVRHDLHRRLASVVQTWKTKTCLDGLRQRRFLG